MSWPTPRDLGVRASTDHPLQCSPSISLGFDRTPCPDAPLSYSDPACIELMIDMIDGSVRGSRDEARDSSRLLTHHKLQMHILPTPERKEILSHA
ncbi:uncharacterized protein PSANT_01975 [Moesziomyces antarcticus]|uniref:Uncharacterized protein n=1 Tax=Pseudozyma antarctica TaxID=84753 RepID=A0A5C3FJC3_PSEA2|nr:uncharacterized protein PSANT_01975 [Moesziomyces antarcticus]